MKQFRDSDYYISEDGKIYSHKFNKVRELKQFIQSGGYFSVGMSIDNNGKMYLVHRIVAECYLPDWDENLTVNHKDLDKTNNHKDNLEMVTCKENLHHYLKNKDVNWSAYSKYNNKKHREKYLKEWREKNKEKRREYKRLYYKKLKEVN